MINGFAFKATVFLSCKINLKTSTKKTFLSFFMAKAVFWEEFPENVSGMKIRRAEPQSYCAEATTLLQNAKAEIEKLTGQYQRTGHTWK